MYQHDFTPVLGTPALKVSFLVNWQVLTKKNKNGLSRAV